MNIDNMTTSEIATYLREERHTAFILWQVDDIRRCEAHSIYKEGVDALTDEQCQGILEQIQNDHDCEFGINWHTLESYTDSELYECRRNILDERFSDEVKKYEKAMSHQVMSIEYTALFNVLVLKKQSEDNLTRQWENKVKEILNRK